MNMSVLEREDSDKELMKSK